jgi:acetolactate synthase regulatory subunit
VKFNLEIIMANTEGALERILGCLRQRGFVLCAISATETLDQAAMSARVTLQSSRPMELAVKQVRKLYDVHHVRVEEMEEESNGYRQLQVATSQV